MLSNVYVFLHKKIKNEKYTCKHYGHFVIIIHSNCISGGNITHNITTKKLSCSSFPPSGLTIVHNHTIIIAAWEPSISCTFRQERSKPIQWQQQACV